MLRAPLTGSRTGYYFILHHLSCFYFGLPSPIYQPALSLGIAIRPQQEKADSSEQFRELYTVCVSIYLCTRVELDKGGNSLCICMKPLMLSLLLLFSNAAILDDNSCFEVTPSHHHILRDLTLTFTCIVCLCPTL